MSNLLLQKIVLLRVTEVGKNILKKKRPLLLARSVHPVIGLDTYCVIDALQLTYLTQSTAVVTMTNHRGRLRGYRERSEALENHPWQQSIGHPHPKPIKLLQAGWPLLSMCICCSGVMTTPVVSGCHWGSQWVPYATEEHTAIWHFLLSLRVCWYQYPGSLMIRNTWSLKLWNAHNDQSIPVSTIWSYVYQTPATFNFSRTILNMDSHLLGNWKHKSWSSWPFLLNWAALEFFEKIYIYKSAFLQWIWLSIQTESSKIWGWSAKF